MPFTFLALGLKPARCRTFGARLPSALIPGLTAGPIDCRLFEALGCPWSEVRREAPAVNSPGRQAGVSGSNPWERRRCGTRSSAGPSDLTRFSIPTPDLAAGPIQFRPFGPQMDNYSIDDLLHQELFG